MLRSKVAREGWWWRRWAVVVVVAVRVVSGGRRGREYGGADVRDDGIDAVETVDAVDAVDDANEVEEGRDCCSVLRRSIGVVISLQWHSGSSESQLPRSQVLKKGICMCREREGEKGKGEGGEGGRGTQRSKDAARGSGGGDLRQGRFGGFGR
jgi:hypothetical protein